MSSETYRLFGFTAAKGRPPQFIEPVFLNDDELFVQGGVSTNHKVENFTPFHDSIEMLERHSDECLQLGDDRLYAIMESQGRLIYGDREYVSKYLSQNLNAYVDSPFFLSDCMKFTGKRFPGTNFLKTNKDLLELAVTVNSVRKFVSDTPSVRNKLRYCTILDLTLDTSTSSSILTNDDSRTLHNIFHMWVNYAQEKNHKIVLSDRWGSIENRYKETYFKWSPKLDEARNFGAYFRALSDSCVSFEEREENINRAHNLAAISKMRYFGNININDGSREILKDLVVARENEQDFLTENISESIKNSILEKIQLGEINTTDVEIQYYFLCVAIKFSSKTKKDALE